MADYDFRTTWREELREAMEEARDPGPVIAYAPSEAAFDVKFYIETGSLAYPGYPNGVPDVLAWTETQVYHVAMTTDESLMLRWVPRNPPT